jgi:hypothetical protein
VAWVEAQDAKAESLLWQPSGLIECDPDDPERIAPVGCDLGLNVTCTCLAHRAQLVLFLRREPLAFDPQESKPRR